MRESTKSAAIATAALCIFITFVFGESGHHFTAIVFAVVGIFLVAVAS